MKLSPIAFLALYLIATCAGMAQSVSGASATVNAAETEKAGKKLPTQVVVAVFDDETKAEEAASTLKDAASAGILYFRNLAVVSKDEKGAVKVVETGEVTAPYASNVGAIVGGLSCLFLGPMGVLEGATAGAVIGGIGQKIMERRIDQVTEGSITKDQLDKLGVVLTKKSSAIIAVFEEVVVDQKETKKLKWKLDQGTVLAEMAADIRLNLLKGRDVAYSVTLDEDQGISAVRAAGKKNAGKIQSMFVTEKGTAVGRAIVTEKGVVYDVASETDEKASFKSGKIDAEGNHETIVDESIEKEL